MRLADAIYRVILLSFPSSFRQRHGAGMREQFHAQRTLLRRRPLALAALWARSAGDAMWHGLALRRHRDDRSQPGRRSAMLTGAFMQDVRYAVRGLGRARGLTTVIVLTLTLGISANAIMFGVVDQLLLRPPSAIGHADDVRRVYFGSDAPRQPGRLESDNWSYPAVAALRDEVTSFSIAAVTYRRRVSLGEGLDARQLRAGGASAGGRTSRVDLDRIARRGGGDRLRRPGHGPGRGDATP
jgi:hypothetical protein